MAEPNEQEQQEELSEIEIAELANQELKKKNAEIAKLKRELAQKKLYSTATDEEETLMSREECINVISDPNAINYDYAESVCRLVDIELDEGHANPLGEDGQDVYDFFKEVLEECGDDKSRFTAIYQARIGADDKTAVMAYKNATKKK